jgi:hypothetical protein
MEAKVQVNALVSQSLRESLQRAADANQNSVAAEVRRAIASHVERARPIPAGTSEDAVEAGGAARNGDAS